MPKGSPPPMVMLYEWCTCTCKGLPDVGDVTLLSYNFKTPSPETSMAIPKQVMFPSFAHGSFWNLHRSRHNIYKHFVMYETTLISSWSKWSLTVHHTVCTSWNWILASHHPAIMRFGCIMTGTFIMRNDEKTAVWLLRKGEVKIK